MNRRRWIQTEESQRIFQAGSAMHTVEICGECVGRGWIWTRAYEVCPECYGAGKWDQSGERAAVKTWKSHQS